MMPASPLDRLRQQNGSYGGEKCDQSEPRADDAKCWKATTVSHIAIVESPMR